MYFVAKNLLDSLRFKTRKTWRQILSEFLERVFDGGVSSDSSLFNFANRNHVAVADSIVEVDFCPLASNQFHPLLPKLLR